MKSLKLEAQEMEELAARARLWDALTEVAKVATEALKKELKEEVEGGD